MRRVGVREFKNEATTLLGADETLVIERYGKPIGFYLPIEATDRSGGREALGHLGAEIDQLLSEYGLSEDDLVAELARPGRRRRS